MSLRGLVISNLINPQTPTLNRLKLPYLFSCSSYKNVFQVFYPNQIVWFKTVLSTLVFLWDFFPCHAYTGSICEMCDERLYKYSYSYYYTLVLTLNALSWYVILNKRNKKEKIQQLLVSILEYFVHTIESG